jgi:pimeloyl-ACP methyl ester carboxylesterase
MLVETRAQRGEGVSDEARRGEVEQLEARRHHDVWSRLGHITCPTFVAAGRFDGIAPVANSEAIVSRVPDATLHVYEGGHAFFAQDRRALPEIIDFLAS